MAALIAEFIGTFALVFVGAGAIINGQAGLLGVAFAHGLTIAAFGSAFGAVSGGHFNPAVTLAMVSINKIDPVRALGYIVAQVLGAILGALVLTFAFPSDLVATAKLGTPLVAQNVSIGGAIIVEAITTFALVSVIMGTAVDGRAPKLGALFIGLTVTLDILCIGTLTGAAMNPARSLGPALVSGNLENFWVYWVGPILGGVAAAVLYQGVMAHRENA
jgi:aquaporin Z